MMRRSIIAFALVTIFFTGGLVSAAGRRGRQGASKIKTHGIKIGDRTPAETSKSHQPSPSEIPVEEDTESWISDATGIFTQFFSKNTTEESVSKNKPLNQGMTVNTTEHEGNQNPNSSGLVATTIEDCDKKEGTNNSGPEPSDPSTLSGVMANTIEIDLEVTKNSTLEQLEESNQPEDAANNVEEEANNDSNEEANDAVEDPNTSLDALLNQIEELANTVEEEANNDSNEEANDAVEDPNTSLDALLNQIEELANTVEEEANNLAEEVANNTTEEELENNTPEEANNSTVEEPIPTIPEEANNSIEELPHPLPEESNQDEYTHDLNPEFSEAPEEMAEEYELDNNETQPWKELPNNAVEEEVNNVAEEANNTIEESSNAITESNLTGEILPDGRIYRKGMRATVVIRKFSYNFDASRIPDTPSAHEGFDLEEYKNDEDISRLVHEYAKWAESNTHAVSDDEFNNIAHLTERTEPAYKSSNIFNTVRPNSKYLVLDMLLHSMRQKLNFGTAHFLYNELRVCKKKKLYDYHEDSSRWEVKGQAFSYTVDIVVYGCNSKHKRNSDVLVFRKVVTGEFNNANPSDEDIAKAKTYALAKAYVKFGKSK